MRLAFLMALTLGLMVPSQPATADEYPVRTWTNDKGETIEARLLRVSGSTAILKQDEEIVRAPISRLSAADRDWIKLVHEVGRWREWTMVDGTTRRAKFQEIDGDELSFKDMSEEFQLTMAGLSDKDRELLANVYQLVPAPAANYAADSYAPPAGRVEPTAGELGRTASSDGLIERSPPPRAVPRRVTEITLDPDQYVTRSWTNKDGKTIEAELRGVSGGKVVLHFREREFQLPINQLSYDDRNYLKQLMGGGEVVASSGPTTSIAASPSMQFQPLRANSSYSARGSPQASATPPLSNNIVESPDHMPEWVAQQRQRARERTERERQDPLAATRPSFEHHSQHFDSPTPRPATEPTYPTSATATGPMVYEYQCYSCNHKWESTRNLGVGDKCPHCGVRFDSMEDEFGNVEESASLKARRGVGMIKLAFFIGVGICGFLAKLLSR